MAGYIFSISQSLWSSFCNENILHGFFTPYVPSILEEDAQGQKRKALTKVLAATFGDMISMKAGDNVYFLSNRKLYGIGTLINIGTDCKYDNYIGASSLIPDYQITGAEYLASHDSRARWVCFFKPSPHFFKKGVDMDDVLRFRPQAFKMLRAFEGLSFIKIDDEENRALKEYISLANEISYENIQENVFCFNDEVHQSIATKDLSLYIMNIFSALTNQENHEYVISEMFIESSLLQQLSADAVPPMGTWDYLTHQIIASPFKPLQYIDKIDIFGYRFSQNYQEAPKLITKYVLVELKKDLINKAALEQTMQYVDWICNEYASGDYSKIEAFVIGSRAARGLENSFQDICQRTYISESHPPKQQKWNNVKLIKYTITNTVEFEQIVL